MLLVSLCCDVAVLKWASPDDVCTCRYLAVHTIVLYAKVVSALPNDAPAAAVDAAAAPAAAAASP